MTTPNAAHEARKRRAAGHRSARTAARIWRADWRLAGPTSTAAPRTDVTATATLTPRGRSRSGVRGAVDRPVADRGDERLGPRRHRLGRAGLYRVRRGRDRPVRFHRRSWLAGLPPGRAGWSCRCRVHLGWCRRGRPHQRPRVGGSCRWRDDRGSSVRPLGRRLQFPSKTAGDYVAG
jgi:hypothetical protein